MKVYAANLLTSLTFTKKKMLAPHPARTHFPEDCGFCIVCVAAWSAVLEIRRPRIFLDISYELLIEYDLVAIRCEGFRWTVCESRLVSSEGSYLSSCVAYLGFLIISRIIVVLLILEPRGVDVSKRAVDFAAYK